MEELQCCAPACRFATQPTSLSFQGEAARLTGLNVSEDQSTDIDILTAEGDKVTLSSDYHAKATLLTYEHLAFSNAGYQEDKGSLVAYDEERSIALSVEGDLSEQEITDIQALLADLGRMLKGFLIGGGAAEAGAQQDAVDLSRYGSLSSYQADFEYKASLQYVNLDADQLTVGLAESPRELPAAPETSPSAAEQSEAAVAPAVTEAPQGLVPAAVEDSQAADQMAHRVRQSGLRPRRLMKLLRKFMRGRMREMRSNNIVDGERAKRGESVLEKFFDRLEQNSGVSELKATKVSVKQQWVSLQYEMKAEVQQTAPIAEETA